MNPILQWLSMGGYGAYVWSTYGLVFIVLMLGLVRARHLRMRSRRLLLSWFKRGV